MLTISPGRPALGVGLSCRDADDGAGESDSGRPGGLRGGRPGRPGLADLKKIIAGETWDSLAGAEPVAVEQRLIRGGELVTLSTYADGSITASGVERATPPVDPGSIRPFDVSRCTSRQSGQVRIKTGGCNVWASTVLITMSFEADYNQTFSASDPVWVTAGSIVAVRYANASTLAGTYSVRNFGRTQINATASSPGQGAPDARCPGSRGAVLQRQCGYS